MKPKRKTAKAGLTIVEILVSVASIGIIATLVIQLVNEKRQFSKQKAFEQDFIGSEFFKKAAAADIEHQVPEAKIIKGKAIVGNIRDFLEDNGSYLHLMTKSEGNNFLRTLESPIVKAVLTGVVDDINADEIKAAKADYHFNEGLVDAILEFQAEWIE